MTTQDKDRIECAIRHIQTAVDVDPWAAEIAVKAMKAQLSAEGTTSDLISRQDAIDALMDFDKKLRKINWYQYPHTEYECRGVDEAIVKIENVPSAQPTLCGYDIEHLILIANVLRKENLPPERITEVITDIGRIVSIVRDEFTEKLLKAVEQCEI